MTTTIQAIEFDDALVDVSAVAAGRHATIDHDANLAAIRTLRRTS